MSIIKEFKDFAVKGNMMDMAIGIIIGASFNRVLDVLVKKIIIPPLSFISSDVNIGEKRVILKEASDVAKEISIQYGALIEVIIDFFIIGLTLFVVVKVMNKIKDKSDDTNDISVRTPKNIQLLTNIDKSLKEQTELLKIKKNEGIE